jgi:SAM-dependent methyltransferase
MEGFDPLRAFNGEVARRYDNDARGDEAETVAFLHRLAGGGPVLELAIGTGRIGLPLSREGVNVDGIESSPDMVAQLRSKPGGDQLAITVGDMSRDAPPGGPYRLAYVVFNTIFNLLTQDDQVRCFEHVAAHLTGDGIFMVEAATPNSLHRLRNDQYVDAEAVEVDAVWLDIGRFDPVTQTLDESHVHLSNAGVELFPIVTRYIWPSEMDLMARIAGLRLLERWAGWNSEPFTGASERHVSVYGR